MDLLKLLRAEHSKKQTDRIVDYIGADKDRFALLMKLFLQGEYRITQRAAWPRHEHLLSFCGGAGNAYCRQGVLAVDTFQSFG